MIFNTTRFREHIGAVPLDIELGYVPISHGGQYSGLYISSTAARMTRLAKCLANGKINMVGSFEQVYMEIDCMDDEVSPGGITYQELTFTSMLSVIAELTPFSDFNKSPHAMILNRSSHERGFGCGAIYKIRGGAVLHHFGLGLDSPRSWREKVNKDGLLCIGVTLHEGNPIFSYIDGTTGKTSTKKYKGMEEGILDDIRILESDHSDTELSSRHGQKGACSQKWASVDMQCSESGIQPDVIINPHTFPSPMTIGMFVESLVGKSGAIHVMAQDATPFAFNETFTATDCFGDQLKAARYNYHGNEPMWSGITGEEFKVDIYLKSMFAQADARDLKLSPPLPKRCRCSAPRVCLC
ncbi:hypothetical protein EDD21DRAFT_407072 [Dissophora ornata]|nr:hypothetical protein EDD21DRAFT_407072 [Dissophora ornata]